MLRAIIKPATPSLALWEAFLKRRPDLVRPPPRLIKNPFSGNTVEFHEPPGVVRIIHEGHILGAIEPSAEFTLDGELLLYSRGRAPGGLREIIDKLCIDLDASLEWFDDEEDDDADVSET